MHTYRSLLAISAFVVATGASAQGLEIRLTDPSVTITIPDLAPFELGPHPNAPRQPTARLFGSSKDGVSLSVLAPTAEASTTSLQCAGWLGGSAVSRFAPDLGAVQFIRAGDNAWVVLFPFTVVPIEQLKAFVVSGNGKGHCLEVHISRTNATAEQRQQWFSGFRNVRVKSD